VESICVPLNFTDSLFCLRGVSSQLKTYQRLSSQQNSCYEIMACKNSASLQKRYNTTLWMSKTNGCRVYECDNVTGGISWNNCNSTEEVSRTCVVDECVETKKLNDEAWTVNIDVGVGLNYDEVDTADIVSFITNRSSLDMDDFKIGTEVNNEGKLLKLYVLVNDEEHAQAVAEVVTSVRNEVDCESVTKQSMMFFVIAIISPSFQRISFWMKVII